MTAQAIDYELLSFDLFDDATGGTRGTLLSIHEETDVARLLEALHAERRYRLDDRDAILVRCAPWKRFSHGPSPAEEKVLAELSNRFPQKNVLRLYSAEYDHKLSPVQCADDASMEAAHDALIAGIRQREMQEFVRTTGALLAGGTAYRFRIPSGKYTSAFLRVGNIQNRRHVLDAVGFWMLPYLRDVAGLVADTWSIGSIALNVARLCSIYDPQRPALRIDLLSHYQDGRAGTRSETSAILSRASRAFSEPFLMVFSASLTGAGLARVANVLEAARYQQSKKFLVLYRLGEPIVIGSSPVPELCNLSGVIRAVDERGATRDRKQGTVVIDPDSYFPVIAREDTRRITKAIGLRNRKFFDLYRNVMRVHCDAFVGAQRFRHHAFAIDVSAMLASSVFRERFARSICKLDPIPRLIICPPSESARALATLAHSELQRAHDVRTPIWCTLDLRSFYDSATGAPSDEVSSSALGAFGSDRSVLVIDDVVTTGSRLTVLQRALRSASFRGRIHYLVAVDRMPSDEAMQSLSSTLRHNEFGQPHSVVSVEKVRLPDWDDAQCPWCSEGKILDDLIRLNAGAVSAETRARANRLRGGREQGLRDDVFMPVHGAAQMALSINSVFVDAPASPATVAAAVASAVQEMRAEKDEFRRLDAGGFPFRSILRHADLDRYTDSILRAAIFRAAFAIEVRTSSEEGEIERAEWARRILKSARQEDRQLRRELLLAIVAEKLPWQSLDAETLTELRRTGFAEFCNLVARNRV